MSIFGISLIKVGYNLLSLVEQKQFHLQYIFVIHFTCYILHKVTSGFGRTWLPRTRISSDEPISKPGSSAPIPTALKRRTATAIILSEGRVLWLSMNICLISNNLAYPKKAILDFVSSNEQKIKQMYLDHNKSLVFQRIS